ncbi:hypothetical protein [Pelagibacterium lacus]|uniref:Uncharacterized protein n=1 Tax=Pelagibacterium lacus TaxID=2282655 RepID=A0A369W2E1_9HYPH|nr:hypothetical protein [Pelagibacterium lacus]RDE08117.1 hypothetical protein DVH29_13180 [Pelagibacterium lacus]
MGPLEVVGYLLAVIDLFDKADTAERMLRSFTRWSREKLRWVPLRISLAVAFLASFIGRLSVRSFDLTSDSAWESPWGPALGVSTMVILLIALGAFAIVLAHIFAAVLHFFQKHPKGIMGSIGLLLTILPSLLRWVTR